jgi:hypothetical protein
MSVLSIWTVYKRPSDYPALYVARRHESRSDGTAVATLEAVFADTLEAVRAKLPPGLVCIPRDPTDDPVIVESWI